MNHSMRFDKEYDEERAKTKAAARDLGRFFSTFAVPTSRRELVEIIIGRANILASELNAEKTFEKLGVKPKGIAVTHILHHGRPLCEFTSVAPREWPVEHHWVRLSRASNATCEKCKQKIPPIS